MDRLCPCVGFCPSGEFFLGILFKSLVVLVLLSSFEIVHLGAYLCGAQHFRNLFQGEFILSGLYLKWGLLSCGFVEPFERA